MYFISGRWGHVAVVVVAVVMTMGLAACGGQPYRGVLENVESIL
jgi:hypothetical protein